MNFYLLKKQAKLRLDWRLFGKVMLAAVVMGFVLSWLRQWNVIVLIIIGGVIYFGILYLIGGLKLKEIREIKGN